MSDVPATREPIVNVQVKTFEDVQRVAKMFSESGYFQDARELAKAGVKIMAGQELGIGPFAAMQGIHMIQGKLGLAAGLVSSRIKASGKYDYRIRVWSNEACVLVFHEHGKPVGESSFTLEDARRADLVKPGSNWQKWPRAMVFSRALTQGARAYCPDVFHGPVYTPDELGAEVDVETGQPVDIPMPSPSKTEPPAPPPQAGNGKDEPVPNGGRGPSYAPMGAIMMIAKMGGGRFDADQLEARFGEGTRNRTALEALASNDPETYKRLYRALHDEYEAFKSNAA